MPHCNPDQIGFIVGWARKSLLKILFYAKGNANFVWYHV